MTRWSIETDQKDPRLPWIMIGHGHFRTVGGKRPITQNRWSPGGCVQAPCRAPYRIQVPVNILSVLNRSQNAALSWLQGAAELIELTGWYELLGRRQWEPAVAFDRLEPPQSHPERSYRAP